MKLWQTDKTLKLTNNRARACTFDSLQHTPGGARLLVTDYHVATSGSLIPKESMTLNKKHLVDQCKLFL